MIVAGLTSASVTRADIYAETYRFMGEPFPGPFTFKYHPWTREMLCCDAEDCVGQKAAQMGYTDSVGMNRTFFTLDQLKRDVLYVLPAKTPDATDFSSGRFGPALEMSPHLRAIFTNVNNVGLKRAGTNSLYIRGSRSRSALKSLPVGLIILDEEDEFDQAAISLVRERISGQRAGARQIWHISTPSVPDHGINITFKLSDQRFFVIRCPYCSKYISLTYPDSLVITGDHPTDPKLKNSHYICTECKKPLPSHINENGIDLAKVEILQDSKWIPTYPDRNIAGFQINQMYSCTISPYQIAYHALLAKQDPVEEQEFHNSKMGQTHIVEGANISDQEINEVMSNYRMRDQRYMKGLLTMGIDVGKELHISVVHWRFPHRSSIDVNQDAIGSVVWAGIREEFEEIDDLIYLFKPSMTVIDQMPETRKSFDLAARFPGRVKLCHYADSIKARSIVGDEDIVSVNRTAWFDMVFGRFFKKTISLPVDIPQAFKNHLKNLIRVARKKKNTDEVYYAYVNTGPDHFGQSINYAEIALKCAHVGIGNNPLAGRTR